jgi:SAM-dependent methyltransferase
MHASVMAFVRERLENNHAAGKHVLEIGSYNVNGSVREIIEPMKPASYHGIDIRPGPGVDEVCDWTEREPNPNEHYDLIICCEMLEHCKDWQVAVESMKDLPPPSELIITTRSPGFPLHEEPDYWRFTIEMFRQAFSDMRVLALIPDPQVPGVFLHAASVSPTAWVDLDEIEAIPMWR